VLFFPPTKRTHLDQEQMATGGAQNSPSNGTVDCLAQNLAIMVKTLKSLPHLNEALRC
jgi:hypothetical protein